MKAIEASPQSIATILRGHEFIIPEYQRDYSWGEDECTKLWDDLSSFFEKTLDKGNKEQEKYFLGSIVVYPNKKNDNIWEVIDGQQRLTTLLMLIKVLSERASTYTILQKMIYKENPETGDIQLDKPRLESYVQGKIDGKNDGKNDRISLCAILSGNSDDLKKDNIFRSNYEKLNQLLDNWWEQELKVEQRKKIINILQNNVVMLPIKCETEDNALCLFETINDRGKPLCDVDIFKAKIYTSVPHVNRNEFIDRWNAIESDREWIFRIYMNILKAEQGVIDRKNNTREYILENLLGNKNKIADGWRNIMKTIELLDYVIMNSTSNNPNTIAKENIYWGILGKYPNNNWCFPFYVFLYKHMKNQTLPEEKHKEYIDLLENTTRYFLIKGVVHNALESVRDTTYRVCTAIFKGENYADLYKNNAKDDMSDFCKKLEESDLRRYDKSMVLLNSSLTPNQNPGHYGKMISNKYHIEHILPKNFNHYDKWTEKSHEQYIDKIGNLMPLEMKLNINASNEFFLRKQAKYEESGVQDALNLANKKPPHWYPEDVEQRQKESVKRLKKFFAEFEE